ncbi:MAG: thioredoxin domain-containing protein [Desulfobacteraceae bacterium]|jgi:protein-disulfide isomerase
MIAPICTAQVEWRVLQTLALPGEPIDVKVSANGQWIYVLTKSRDLLVYTAKGELKDTIKAGPQIDNIEVGPSENTLYLMNNRQKQIKIIDVTYVRDINITHSPFKGKADAPVVIVDYTDFQCPYCAKLAHILEQLLELYPDKVKIVYKSYPLRRHRFAFKAATAAMAAHEKGKFWEFHDRLYEKYNQMNDQVIMDVRKALALDMPEFDTLMNSQKIRDLVIGDYREGYTNGVRGTPTIFINGKRLKDNSLQGFRLAIEKELKTLSIK